MQTLPQHQKTFYSELHPLGVGTFFIGNDTLDGIIYTLNNNGMIVSFRDEVLKENMIASFELEGHINFEHVEMRVIRKYRDEGKWCVLELSFIALNPEQERKLDNYIRKQKLTQFSVDWW